MRGGKRADDDKREKTEAIFEGAKRRADALAAAERAVASFDAAKWLAGAKAARDPAGAVADGVEVGAEIKDRSLTPRLRRVWFVDVAADDVDSSWAERGI